MTLAVVLSRALIGLDAPLVRVEADLANGLPGFSIVGLPGTEVRESRDRVRAAIQHSGAEFPQRRITVNLAPADLPKDSGRLDLAIAVAILAASGQLPTDALDQVECVGELSLSGALQPIRGAFALALARQREARATRGDAEVASTSLTNAASPARTLGDARPAADAPPQRPRRLILPAVSAAEAALCDATQILAAGSLAEVCQHLRGERLLQPPNAERTDEANVDLGGPKDQRAGDSQFDAAQSVKGRTVQARHSAAAHPCLSEVCGQHQARRALEIAAAGGHSLLMIGPPGSGKSMLATRLPGLLPPMDAADAADAAAVQSLIGAFEPQRWGVPAFRAPHHGCSAAALIGGGHLRVRPGELVLATGGVLFLDELPEWDRKTLEMLREPLETGSVAIARVHRQVRFPARTQLVAAMNPCPCGWLGHPKRPCRCAPEAISRYRSKLSGPLLDRLDLVVELTALDAATLRAPRSAVPEHADAAPQSAMHQPLRGASQRMHLGNAATAESSAIVAQRVRAAADRQRRRQTCLNARLSPAQLAVVAALDDTGDTLLRRAIDGLQLSARAYHRVLRLARTLADLQGREAIETADLAEAIGYRRGLDTLAG